MTFTCPFGTFAYRRMPFGLCNAPATFQLCMISIFYDMVERFLEIFLDDFSVFVSSFEECLHHLTLVLVRCKDKNLVLNCEKCHFMVKQGIVLDTSFLTSVLWLTKRKSIWESLALRHVSTSNALKPSGLGVTSPTLVT